MNRTVRFSSVYYLFGTCFGADASSSSDSGRARLVCAGLLIVDLAQSETRDKSSQRSANHYKQYTLYAEHEPGNSVCLSASASKWHKRPQSRSTTRMERSCFSGSCEAWIKLQIESHVSQQTWIARQFGKEQFAFVKPLLHMFAHSAPHLSQASAGAAGVIQDLGEEPPCLIMKGQTPNSLCLGQKSSATSKLCKSSGNLSMIPWGNHVTLFPRAAFQNLGTNNDVPQCSTPW